MPPGLGASGTSVPGAERLYQSVVPPSRIDGSAKVVELLRHPIVGVPEQRLSDTDMFGIADREFSRTYLSE